jgi:phosphoglycolate phosphatase-like HAD superfamily hydrolase
MNVIFDIEGLLLDFRPAVEAALRAAAQATGCPRRTAPGTLALRAVSLQQLLTEHLGLRDTATLERACSAYRTHFVTWRLREAVLHEDAHEIIALMRREHDLSWHYLTTAGYWAARWLIERHALPQSRITLYAPCRPLPPCTRTQALRNLLATRDFVDAPNLVLSDYAEEIAQAADAGARAIGLRYGRSAAEVLVRAPTAHWAASCSEVADWLRRARRTAPAPGTKLSLPLSATLH